MSKELKELNELVGSCDLAERGFIVCDLGYDGTWIDRPERVSVETAIEEARKWSVQIKGTDRKTEAIAWRANVLKLEGRL